MIPTDTASMTNPRQASTPMPMQLTPEYIAKKLGCKLTTSEGWDGVTNPWIPRWVKQTMIELPSGLRLDPGYVKITIWNYTDTPAGWQKFCTYNLVDFERDFVSDPSHPSRSTSPEVTGDPSWYHNRPGGTSPRLDGK